MSSTEQRQPAPLFQGDLAQTPLPEILVTIHRYKVPGMVECRRDDDVKRIYLDGGQIIFATSNVLEDSLGDKLLREGKISRLQYDESARRLASTGKRQGVILAEMKVIEPRELFLALREQIQEIAWSVFSWQSGSVTFQPGRDKQLEFVKIQIPVPQAILEGVRRLPDPRLLVARLGTKSTILERTGNAVPDLELSDEENNLLEQVNGKRTLVDLVSTAPMSQGDNARVLYALFALQVVAEKKHVKVQLKTDGDKYST